MSTGVMRRRKPVVRSGPRTTRRIGDRLPASAGPLRRIWHYHGLSLVLLTLFVVALAGQIFAGWRSYNDEQRHHHAPSATLVEYLGTGHFGEATFENWESEFLQMAFFVVLTVFLYQIGSSESKRPDVIEAVDLDPRDAPTPQTAPWPVRRGGVALLLYENSLSIAFALLFFASFALHALTGVQDFNQDRLAHGEPPATVMGYVASAQFWFESFQNWQSEFLSLAAMVTFTIVLRQRGSPESKPVAAPTWDTGK